MKYFKTISISYCITCTIVNNYKYLVTVKLNLVNVRTIEYTFFR